jgi:hypothetical protein
LPTQPVRKYCAVYNLAKNSYHGMKAIVQCKAHLGREFDGAVVLSLRRLKVARLVETYSGASFPEH